jgi:pyrroline-5-carboxylate reductase
MADSQNDVSIGFLGAGRMATALAAGLLSARFTSPGKIVASDVSPGAREQFARGTGADTTPDNAALPARCSTIVLAVKPQQVGDVLRPLRNLLTDQHLLISIAAGTTLSTLESLTGGACRLVRVMPNTPCLVSAGASAFARGRGATEDDARFVRELLSTVGRAWEVPERLLDAVTGLSGSGPAYAFQIIEALSDGGVRVGLPRDVATQLAAQTLLGAARMVLETGDHPGVLKDAVASPGGTTIAGLHALERGGLRAALINAVEAATLRSQELGRS